MTEHIPPWQDKATLARNICVSKDTVERWAEQGIIPQPRKFGGKLLWKWADVDAWLSGKTEGGPDAEADKIRRGTRRSLLRDSARVYDRREP